MSQTEFCKKIGCKQTSYSGWETGDREPASSAVALICKSCGVSADWLLGLSDKEEDTTGKSNRISELESRLAEANHALDIILKTVTKVKK